MTLQDFCARVSASYKAAGNMCLDDATGEWVTATEYCGRVVEDMRLLVDTFVLEQADQY